MTQHLRRQAFALGAVAAALGVVPLCSQTPAADTSNLKFEVASFKENTTGPGAGVIKPSPGNQTYIGTNMPLRTYLSIAYQVRDAQIVGGPTWLATDRFDMDAKAEKSSTPEELHIMLAHLLEERFQMKIHKEMRDQAGFNLVVDKGGSKMTEHDVADHVYPPMQGTGPGEVSGTNCDMKLLALNLSRALDRQVVDKTGLPAHYDFKLAFLPEQRVNGAGPDGANAVLPPGLADLPSLPDALKQQLGLRLEPTKTATPFLIIDHIEKLTGN